MEPVRLTLIDAGSPQERSAEPLRYHDGSGTQSTTITIGDGFSQHMGSTDSSPKRINPTDIKLPVRAEYRTEGDDHHVDAVTDHPTTDSEPHRADVDAAAGFSFGWTADPYGKIANFRLAAPSGASDQSRSLMERYLMRLVATPVVFPNEPIGNGATWSIEGRVPGESGMLQKVIYKLLEHDGDRAKLELTIEQRPAISVLNLDPSATPAPGPSPTQPAGGPSTPPGAHLKVESAKTISQGTLNVDLAQPIPTDGNVDFTTRVVYSGASGSTVVQDATTTLKFAS